VPNSPVAWLLLVVAVTPGWCAIRGWCMARSTGPPDALGEWLPLAAALGVTWTGVLALSSGTAALTLAAGAGAAWRVALWIGAAASLWVIPFVVAWGMGRLWPDAERWVGDVVTVVMNDGSIIDGRCRRISSTRLTLEDAASGDLRGMEIDIRREEIRFVARAPDAVPVPTPTPDEPAPWDWPVAVARRGTDRRREIS
jgi:hypothetical protein